jgi:hypothetical protein
MVFEAAVVAMQMVLASGQAASSPPAVNDRHINVETFVDAACPTFARDSGITGDVVLRATLDDEGRVADVVALSGHEDLVPDSAANTCCRHDVRASGDGDHGDGGPRTNLKRRARPCSRRGPRQPRELGLDRVHGPERN